MSLSQRVRTGIPGFDSVISGGFREGMNVVLSGSPGKGKKSCYRFTIRSCHAIYKQVLCKTRFAGNGSRIRVPRLYPDDDFRNGRITKNSNRVVCCLWNYSTSLYTQGRHNGTSNSSRQNAWN